MLEILELFRDSLQYINHKHRCDLQVPECSCGARKTVCEIRLAIKAFEDVALSPIVIVPQEEMQEFRDCFKPVYEKTFEKK